MIFHRWFIDLLWKFPMMPRRFDALRPCRGNTPTEICCPSMWSQPTLALATWMDQAVDNQRIQPTKMGMFREIPTQVFFLNWILYIVGYIYIYIYIYRVHQLVLKCGMAKNRWFNGNMSFFFHGIWAVHGIYSTKMGGWTVEPSRSFFVEIRPALGWWNTQDGRVYVAWQKRFWRSIPGDVGMGWSSARVQISQKRNRILMRID